MDPCCSSADSGAKHEHEGSSPSAAPNAASSALPASMNGLASHGTVIIHTGNVRRCNRMRAVLKPTTRDEVSTALRCALTCWRKVEGAVPVFSREIIGHPRLMQEIPVEDRPTSEILVKLFLCEDLSPQYVKDAVDAVFYATSPEKIDTLVVSHPSLREAVPAPEFAAVWKALEAQAGEGRVKAVGVADLGVAGLEWMRATCASMPNVNMLDMSSADAATLLPSSPLWEYAQQHGIRLISHDDGKEILPASVFCGQMNEALDGQGSSVRWKPLWVARYTVIDAPRSLITNLGYVICGEYSSSA